MNVVEQRPLFSGQLRVGSGPIGFSASAVSAENEGTRVARVVQDVQSSAMSEFCPDQFAFVWPPLQPSRKQELFLAEGLDDSAGRTSAAEFVEQESNAFLHLLYSCSQHSAPLVLPAPPAKPSAPNRSARRL